MQSAECQLHCLLLIYEPVGKLERIWQFRHRLQRFTKRRINYFRNWLYSKRIFAKPEKPSSSQIEKNQIDHLRPGDLVRIRSWEEIRATLNHWNSLKGCTIMEEMKPYCGTTQKVYKRIERFLDERDYLIKKSKGLIILENVICDGTIDFGKCDRSCFFFWREEWLEKVY